MPTTAASSRTKPAQRPPRTARPAAVTITVDRALKQRWESAIAAIHAARREGAGAFDALWEAAAEIVEHEPPLYLAGGFATAKAFIQQQLGETERNARRNMRIAKFASPSEEAQYGTSKLDAALTLLEAKAGELKGRLPVDFAKLRIPVDRPGGDKTVSFEEATVQEILVAARRLQRGDKTKAPASPTVAAVTKALQSKSLKGVSVRVAGGKLSLGGIPLEAIGELSRALGKVKLPKGK